MTNVSKAGLFKASLAAIVLLAGCTDKTKEATSTRTPASGSTAPSGPDAARRDTALVRFIQAIPTARVDLLFGDTKVFTNVPYKEVTQYVDLPAERHEFKIIPAGQTPTASSASNSEGLSAGGRYTVLATRKENGEFTLLSLNDDLSAPSTGKAKIRVINAAAGVGKTDVIGPNGKIFSGINTLSSTSYKEVPAKQGILEVRNAKQLEIARLSSFDLQPSKLYTFVIAGGAGKPIEILPITDQLVPAG